MRRFWLVGGWLLVVGLARGAEDPPPAAKPLESPATAAPAPSGPPATIPAPQKVDVQPMADDDQISVRLERILRATGWFESPRVAVQDGVVFISGKSRDQASKDWASDLARNTQDVVAVVNHLQITQSSMWDFRPAWESMREIWRSGIGFLPFGAVGLSILALAWLGARLTARTSRSILRRRMPATLLADVIARAAAVVVLLLGIYFVLRVSGLTRLALTFLGGTGLLGLVIGIAFRDITENFLSSIFLSLQHPFRVGDLVEIAGVQGYVQRVNIRSTVLMTLAGNHVQVPNAVVYKSTLFNFTSNPNRREDFTLAIGLGDSVTVAQDAILQVLEQHPAVLAEPEPWVLVEGLAGGDITLRVYFWLDGSQHSWLKVRSSVMRLAKNALQERQMLRGVDGRERFLPRGLDVRLIADSSAGELAPKSTPRRQPRDANGEAPRPESHRISTAAEGKLQSEATQIEEQARQARTPEGGENLLQPESDADASATKPSREPAR
ncbi:MAG: mechanosensitive ion channel [Planctomycetaceae bacterium]|nr:mechanosensitive ion channel [Planctomycetaceae bacterium]